MTSSTAAAMASWSYLTRGWEKEKQEKAQQEKQTAGLMTQESMQPINERPATPVNVFTVATKQPYCPTTSSMTSLPDTFSYSVVQPSAVMPRFGAEVTVLGWLLSATSTHLVTKGIDATLSDATKLNAQFEHPTAFNQGINYLDLAKAAYGQEQKGYLNKAEEEFINSAHASDILYFSAESYKYAALSAKLAGKSSGVVKAHAQKALNTYRGSCAALDSKLEDARMNDAIPWLLRATIGVPLYVLEGYFKLAAGGKHMAVKDSQSSNAYRQKFNDERAQFYKEVSESGFATTQFIQGSAKKHQDKIAALAKQCYNSDLPAVCERLMSSP
ncbi:MAG: hypothetical protein SFZ03_10665 [Candidatus Melainabacteria bacterium]|nr:hypothetical protein [Candidatus Melainabacteria bacterium]